MLYLLKNSFLKACTSILRSKLQKFVVKLNYFLTGGIDIMTFEPQR